MPREFSFEREQKLIRKESNDRLYNKMLLLLFKTKKNKQQQNNIQMKKKNFDDLQAPNSSLALSLTLPLFLLPARVMTNTPQKHKLSKQSAINSRIEEEYNKITSFDFNWFLMNGFGLR